MVGRAGVLVIQRKALASKGLPATVSRLLAMEPFPSDLLCTGIGHQEDGDGSRRLIRQAS